MIYDHHEYVSKQLNLLIHSTCLNSVCFLHIDMDCYNQARDVSSLHRFVRIIQHLVVVISLFCNITWAACLCWKPSPDVELALSILAILLPCLLLSLDGLLQGLLFTVLAVCWGILFVATTPASQPENSKSDKWPWMSIESPERVNSPLPKHVKQKGNINDNSSILFSHVFNNLALYRFIHDDPETESVFNGAAEQAEYSSLYLMGAICKGPPTENYYMPLIQFELEIGTT